MKISMKLFAVPMLGAIVLGLVAFTYPATGEWKVPDADQKVKNPVKAEKASIDAGAALYGKHCKSCHGKTGEGDGPKASELKTELTDFSGAKFQGQSDGAMFYKILKGRDEMPSFAKKITEDNDVWNLVNYVRTLKKK